MYQQALAKHFTSFDHTLLAASLSSPERSELNTSETRGGPPSHKAYSYRFVESSTNEPVLSVSKWYQQNETDYMQIGETAFS